jgi:hypothetical protein
MRRWAAFLAVLAAVGPAHAVSTSAIPVHHGVLRIAESRGTVNRDSGIAQVTVKRWSLVLSLSSNGVFPDQEPIVIALGDDNFRLEPGTLKANKSGKVFRYKAPKRPRVERGVTSIVIKRRFDDSYAVAFTVRGVQLYDLNRRAPLCLPTAFILGDDDGFIGVEFDSPRSPPLKTTRVVVGRTTCPAEEWPWA